MKFVLQTKMINEYLLSKFSDSFFNAILNVTCSGCKVNLYHPQCTILYAHWTRH